MNSNVTDLAAILQSAAGNGRVARARHEAAAEALELAEIDLQDAKERVKKLQSRVAEMSEAESIAYLDLKQTSDAWDIAYKNYMDATVQPVHT